MPLESAGDAAPTNATQGHLSSWAARAARWSPTTRALLWSAGAGLTFSVLNTMMRRLSLDVPPMQVQFLRYFFGILVMLPWIWHAGLAAFRPRQVLGQFTRGAVHAAGLALWFIALPRIPLADMTAIGFTGPIFIMIGAALFLREPMRWQRWLATAFGFAGVLVVVGPKLSAQGGGYHLVMLASAPVFAASFLLTKLLTRHDSPQVIVLWQSISVSLLSLPLALLSWQWLTAGQWAGFALSGLLGSAGHYCLTRSYVHAEISATQSLKFLDLIWASMLGWLVFGDVPLATTLLGGVVICTATLWVAHREAATARRDNETARRDDVTLPGRG